MPNFTMSESPSPQKSSTPATKITLLDHAPKVMRRPLELIDGKAYAASMQYVLIEGNKDKNSSPTNELILTVLREDGVIFYNGQPEFSKLGFAVNISELPNSETAISAQAIKRYKSGERVDPKVIFQKLNETVDRFIDFERSLSAQDEMCELIACFILASWFLEAFNVIGFLWINGEKGSGKTQLLTIVSSLSYEGHLLLSAGTYATLRDYADIGSTLCIDEAENLNHAQFSADKREILLSGNRKGSKISLKGKDKDGNWVTRYTNTYCMRIFAAIAKPEPVIASRSIIIPLIRTSKKEKANSDAYDSKLWPHELRKLIDDLWLMVLANLSQMSSYETKVNELSQLIGRDLEPWRAVLSIALWLEEQGVIGLFERMNNLSISYQEERKNIESIDVNALIIIALINCLKREVVNLCERCEGNVDTGSKFITTSDISFMAIQLMGDLDLDISDDDLTPCKVGKKMSSLRFNNGRKGGTGNAGWKVSNKELSQWVSKLGLCNHSKGDTPVESSQPSQPARRFTYAPDMKDVKG